MKECQAQVELPEGHPRRPYERRECGSPANSQVIDSFRGNAWWACDACIKFNGWRPREADYFRGPDD